jgi:sugar-specific transcriptional regulator TrmB
VTGPDVVERLVHLGLTQYEARAYAALIRRDGSTPAEVAKVAGVPRPRIYDVMDSLVAKGLVIERPGRAAKFAAVRPAEAVGLLVEAHRARLGALEAEADAVAAVLTPAYAEGSVHGDPLDYIEVIRSPDAIARRFTELLDSVEREVLSFTKSPFAVRIDENDAGLDVARARRVRAVYELSVLADPATVSAIRRFAEAGEQARFVAELPMKLQIIDERLVMLSMADPVAGEGGLTTMVIENAQLAACLKLAFEQVWASGISFADAV